MSWEEALEGRLHAVGPPPSPALEARVRALEGSVAREAGEGRPRGLGRLALPLAASLAAGFLLGALIAREERPIELAAPGRRAFAFAKPFTIHAPGGTISGERAELVVEVPEIRGGELMLGGKTLKAAVPFTFAAGVLSGVVFVRATDGASAAVHPGEVALAERSGHVSVVAVDELGARSADTEKALAAALEQLEREKARALAAEEKSKALEARLAGIAAPGTASAPRPEMDPVGEIVFGKTTLREKLRSLAALDAKTRSTAAWKLGQEWSDHKERAAEVLAALREETDPECLLALALVIRAGAPLDHAAARDVLRSGEPAERRVAAAWGARPEGYSPSPELDASLAAIVKNERDPRVLGTLGRALYDTTEQLSETVGALREAVATLPAGDERRSVLEAVARASIFHPGPAKLYEEWRKTSDPDLRDDIAAGIARAARSGMTTNAEGQLAGTDANKKGFLELYGATRNPTTRRQLFIAAAMDRFGEEKTAFAREVASVEPDPEQRARLERYAVAEEKGELRGTGDEERIIYGKD